jgi:NAD(P)-dependent dehydrogenase (short-subunit alcohol dehydrogenase family)
MNSPSLLLKGKTAIITGASQGIGKAVATGFAQAGCNVALVARSESRLKSFAQEIISRGGKALAVPTDVTDSISVSKMVDRTVEAFGQIDILVNCVGGAGKNPMVPLLEMTEETWDEIQDRNLKSVYLCCKIAGKVMTLQKRGSIINFSSGAATQPTPAHTHYCAAKAGVNQFTRTLAVEWGHFNIRVNAISPGLTDTEYIKENLPQSVVEKYSKMIPLGRIGQPEDMVGIAVCLASDASSFISGVIIPVSGGPQ